MDQTNTYHSLADIRSRKEMLRNDIKEDNKKIKGLWKSLFQPDDSFSRKASPSKRFSGFLNISAGVIDGALLGWKLYRKFKR